MKLSIVRKWRYPETPNGAFGQLFVDGEFFSVTCENADDLIPVGEYVLVPHDTEKHPGVVAFVNPRLLVFHEPGDAPPGTEGAIRTACLIHVANFPDELEGCTAPGENVARFPGRGWGVSASRRMLTKLQALWGDRSNLTASITEEWEA